MPNLLCILILKTMMKKKGKGEPNHGDWGTNGVRICPLYYDNLLIRS